MALRVVTSPRTPADVLGHLRRLRSRNHFTLNQFGEPPLSAILAGGGRFVVTGDSASMVADACRTGAPVWLFPLRRRPNPNTLLQHASDRCFGPALRHAMVRRGWVGGGSDYRRWHCELERLGYIRGERRVPDAALRWMPAGPRPDDDLGRCRQRLLDLLARR